MPGSGRLSSGSIDRVQSYLDINFTIPAQCWWRGDLDRRLDGAPDLRRAYSGMMSGAGALGVLLQPERAEAPGTPSRGHAFVSYVREDSPRVDQLQGVLEAAGIPVWRDTADLWPGQDWRAMIRRAITDDALVFIACFSQRSLKRVKSYQNEEFIMAMEQLRLRHSEDPWLISVRLDECEIPDRELGGRTLASIQRVDLFGDGWERRMGTGRCPARCDHKASPGTRPRYPLIKTVAAGSEFRPHVFPELARFSVRPGWRG